VSRTGEVKATTPSAGLKYYALAVVASAAATVLKVALATYVVPTYILAYPAVMLAATLGGLGPGLLATALTAVMAWYWVIPPEGFGPLSLQDAASLVLFVGMGVFMSIVANVYRQAAHRVELLERERALWVSEERYRRLFETMPVGVTYQDAETTILAANPAAERILGLSLDQIQGRTSLDPRWKTIHPDGSDFPGSEHPSMAALRTGKEIRGELMGVFNPSLGSTTWISVSAVPVPGSGSPSEKSVFTTFEDVTKQTLAEIALREAEERLRRFFEATQEMVVLHQLVTDAAGSPVDYRIIDCNPRFTAVTGITRERAVGALASVLFGTPQAPYLDTYAAVVQSGKSHTFETFFAPMEKHFRVSAFSTGPGSFATSSHDITDIKLAEAALVASKEELQLQKARLDAAALSGKLGLWDLDLVTDAAWRTPQHDRLFGYEELQPTWGYEVCLRHIVPEDRPIFQRAFEEAYVTGHLHFELRIDRVGRPMAWIEASGEVIRDEAGKPIRMRGTVADITERKQAEAALRETQGILQAAMDQSPAGIAIADAPLGKLRYVNDAGLFIRGEHRETVVNEIGIDRYVASWHLLDLDGNPLAPDAVPLARAILYGETNSREFIIRRSPGDDRVVAARAAPVANAEGKVTSAVVVFLDITEARALQAQLALTSRLAALGTLVAGVAHEVNNPLAAALSGQDLALGAVRDLRDRLRWSGPLDREAEIHRLDEVVEELGEAQEAGRRIERIVKDLKVFGRPNHKDARERVRLIDAVDLAMRWLPAAINQTATVTVEDGGALDVVATTGQITQVVVNLVTNAAKAAAEGARGAIVIRVGPGTPGMARLEVIDHGSGIEPAVLPHIFEPYFTTSDVGKGTGLGLPICHSIVTAHGGTLTVESEVGKGSTFRVELPAAPIEA
jgi:PAS domain S-box-containing protein